MISYNLNNKLLLLIKILLVYFFFLTKSFAIENDRLKDITEGNENAKIDIFDLLGRPVKTVSILLNENQNYSWRWDGIDMFDQKVSAGIYFLTITVDQNIETRKITLLK